MRQLYARAVLWLIRPALELNGEKPSTSSVTDSQVLQAFGAIPMASPVSVRVVVRLGDSGDWHMHETFAPLPGVDYDSMSARHALSVEIPRLLAELSERLVFASAQCDEEGA